MFYTQKVNDSMRLAENSKDEQQESLDRECRTLYTKTLKVINYSEKQNMIQNRWLAWKRHRELN